MLRKQPGKLKAGSTPGSVVSLLYIDARRVGQAAAAVPEAISHGARSTVSVLTRLSPSLGLRPFPDPLPPAVVYELIKRSSLPHRLRDRVEGWTKRALELLLRSLRHDIVPEGRNERERNKKVRMRERPGWTGWWRSREILPRRGLVSPHKKHVTSNEPDDATRHCLK